MSKKHLLIVTSLLIAAFGNVTYAGEKMANVRLSPVVLIVGAVDAEADIKVSDNLTVGPMITRWSVDVSGDSLGLLGYGVRANWQMNGAFKDGFYVSPFIKRWSMDITTTDLFGNKLSGDTAFNLFGALVGYQWIWDSFNVNAGVGYGVASLDNVTLKDSYGNTDTFDAGSAPIGGMVYDFSIGWAF